MSIQEPEIRDLNDSVGKIQFMKNWVMTRDPPGYITKISKDFWQIVKSVVDTWNFFLRVIFIVDFKYQLRIDKNFAI